MENVAINQTEQALLSPEIPPGEEARVSAILDNFQEHLGFVPDGLRLYSFSPPLLESFANNIGYFNMGGTQLPPPLTAMIRYQVSWDAGCSFCVDMNEGFLTNMGMKLEDIRASRNNPDAAPLSDNEKAILKLAVKAVEQPEDISKEDIEYVRNKGWKDREIFDAVVQAANNRAFNYVLRTFNIEHQGVLG